MYYSKNQLYEVEYEDGDREKIYHNEIHAHLNQIKDPQVKLYVLSSSSELKIPSSSTKLKIPSSSSKSNKSTSTTNLPSSSTKLKTWFVLASRWHFHFSKTDSVKN